MISTRGNDETEAEDENTIRFGHGMISNYDLSNLQSYHFSRLRQCLTWKLSLPSTFTT